MTWKYLNWSKNYLQISRKQKNKRFSSLFRLIFWGRYFNFHHCHKITLKTKNIKSNTCTQSFQRLIHSISMKIQDSSFKWLQNVLTKFNLQFISRLWHCLWAKKLSRGRIGWKVVFSIHNLKLERSLWTFYSFILSNRISQ